MSLKYYAIEDARYGSMGNITESTALEAIKLACVQFEVPFVVLEVSTRKKNKSVYMPGANMVTPLGRLSKALAVPNISMAESMMDWCTLLHEFAHHLHFVYHDRKVKRLAAAHGLLVHSTMKEDRDAMRVWVRNNIKREHAHGHAHRVNMQKLVDFFVGNGMITTLPTYLSVGASASV